MRLSLSVILGYLLLAVPASAQVHTSKTFDIYLIDVEGGDAALFVAPSGESVLIDTGSGGPDARDANRIMDAVKDAGLTHLDNLITTHWHGDHFGGMAELAARIEIRNFIDHGPNVQHPNGRADDFVPKCLSHHLCQGKAHGRVGRGPDCGGWPRLARGDSGGQGHHEAATGGRSAESRNAPASCPAPRMTTAALRIPTRSAAWSRWESSGSCTWAT